MRVLLLSDFYPPVRGGLEFHVDTLAAELVAAGNSVHVATLTKDAAPTHPGVIVHPVSTASAKFVRHADPSRPFHPPLPDPLARRQLTTLIERVRPDVVHAHSWLAASLPARRPPLVFTAHDYALACQLRTLLRSDGELCDGASVGMCVRCGTASYGRPRSTALAAATVLGRRALRPDAFLAVSEHVRRMLQPHVASPIDVVHGFVPAPAAGRMTRSRLDLPRGPLVMFAGDPGRHKGVDTLIDVWADPEPPRAALVLATTKPVELRLPPRVHVRHYERDEMLAAWRHAVMAVVPSRWHEPFPTVAMEALTAGVPVVASRVGGLVDIVRDGVDGLLVPAGDAHALRNAVRSLLSDSALRARLREQAVAGAARFRSDAMARRIEGIYADLILARRGVA